MSAYCWIISLYVECIFEDIYQEEKVTVIFFKSLHYLLTLHVWQTNRAQKSLIIIFSSQRSTDKALLLYWQSDAQVNWKFCQKYLCIFKVPQVIPFSLGSTAINCSAGVIRVEGFYADSLPLTKLFSLISYQFV